MQTRVLAFTDDAIAEASQLILAGEPVAVPTETVYGLAANATNARGMQVTVSVTSVVDLSVPSLVGFEGFSLQASSTMLVNH